MECGTHQGHTPQGPFLRGFSSLRRVGPRRDLGDAPFPDCVPGLTLVKAVRLHDRPRGQQGPEGSRRGIYRRRHRISTAGGRHHVQCAQPGSPHRRSCRRGVAFAAKSCLRGGGGADPCSSLPTRHRKILPRATLMSSCAQPGCEGAICWTGRCPDQQIHPLHCSRLRSPLPFPVQTHGKRGGVGGGGGARARPQLVPGALVGVPSRQLPDTGPGCGGSLLVGSRSLVRRCRCRCRCRGRFLYGRPGPGRGWCAP